MNVLLVLIGLVLLVLGGDRLVRGAAQIARSAGISEATVGLTVVAAGTSLPELIVSLDAARTGSPDLAAGNVIGSNIYNLSLILGLTALIRPMIVEGLTVRLHWPAAMLSALALTGLGWDGTISRADGGLLLAGWLAFTVYMVRAARDAPEDLAAEAPMPARRALVEVAVGLLLLVLGGRALTSGAVALATAAGISERIIGLTVVAVGTSLPELFTSLVAAWRGNAAIAITNVLGSNLFNATIIIGATSLLVPVAVSAELATGDAVWMLGLTVLLLPLVRTGFRLSRGEGALLLAAAVAYTATLML